ncbi:MAG: hypothetical protein V1850_02180 [Candidatus Bathyarchaeota archaeon]
MIQFLFLLILALTVTVTAWIELYEVVSEVKVLNPVGCNRTALVVYQKGLIDFQPKMVFAFAEGLASSGWRVDVTTVSPRAPTDISSYDLLVIARPTYFFSPFLC